MAPPQREVPPTRRLNVMTKEAILNLTTELVNRPSENPPGNEAYVAEFLRERLESSPVPFDIETYEVKPDRQNVIARVGDPEGTTLLLSGHTDVVPANPDEWITDPYDLTQDGSRVVGRGVADMKGALAAKLIATEEVLKSDRPRGEVILAFVVDEEWDGAGTREMVARGLEADFAVIGEPTGMDVAIAQKGIARYELRARGRSSHSGRPDMGVNAISSLRKALDHVDKFDQSLHDKTNHRHLTPESVAITQIQGGSAPNVIPDQARATVDWRFLPDRSNDPTQFDDEMARLVEETKVKNGSKVDVNRRSFSRSVEIPSDSELVQCTIAAAEGVNRSGEVIGFNAATDARYTVHDAGIPTVLFGPGSIENDAHTTDESVAVDDLVDASEVYERLLTEFVL